MQERPPIWRAAANTLTKQSRTADKGLFSSLGVGQDANKSSPLKRILLRNIQTESTCECGDELTGGIKCGEILD
jgi:hypothetical protein